MSVSRYLGLALGATSTAVAVTSAIKKAHGASPRFVVVPLVGACFVEVADAVTIRTFVGRLVR